MRVAFQHDYQRGHVETVGQFLNRGGQITSVAPAWSRHLTDEDTLLTILCGGSGDDAERGYADADLPVSLRESMTSRFLDPLFAVEEE